MAIKWGARRQILYYIVGAVILTALLGAAYQLFFVKTPTCFDKEQNAGEQGVDCGGSCSLMCANVAKAPTVLWARSFLTAPHTYTAVAYIQNNNVAVSAGARQVHYTFRLYDAQNFLITAKEGVADIAPIQNVPIVELGIDTGTREVARTLFEFRDEAMIWNKVPEDAIEKIRVVDPGRYQDGRLTSSIANDAYEDTRRVQVVAILFDNNEVARAASKATISKIGRRSIENITFTWPDAPTGTFIPKVIVLPSF